MPTNINGGHDNYKKTCCYICAGVPEPNNVCIICNAVGGSDVLATKVRNLRKEVKGKAVQSMHYPCKAKP